MATRKVYTQNSLWEAVYAAIPSFRDARAAGCYINLPGAVRNAAAEFFTDNKTEPSDAIAIIRQAMLDLRDIGEFIFQQGFDATTIDTENAEFQKKIESELGCTGWSN